MASILLVDPAQRFVNAFTSACQRRNDTVQAVSTLQEALSWLRRSSAVFDIVVLEFSANRPSNWEVLGAISEAIAMGPVRPVIICVSNRNWGPEVRLEVERKGARLVVVHE